MVNKSFQQTRDSIGSRDQTRSLSFGGVSKERVKVRVVNEVLLTKVNDGATFDVDPFDTVGMGFDGSTYFSDEVLRRQWNWKSYDELRKGVTNTGNIQEGGLTVINLSD